MCVSVCVSHWYSVAVLIVVSCACVFTKFIAIAIAFLNLSYNFFPLLFALFAALKNSSVDAEISVGQRRSEAIFDRSLFQMVFGRDSELKSTSRFKCETHSISRTSKILNGTERE